MKQLTNRQQQVLDFIRERITTDRIPPSLREICDHFGFKSVKAASDHVSALRRKGALKVDSHRARSLWVVSVLDPMRNPVCDIPVFAEIPAGPPHERLQEAKWCLSVDAGTLGIKPAARAFALRVPDDTLDSLHIRRGDRLVFEHGRKPRSGDLVAVLIDGRSALRVFSQLARKGVLSVPGRKGGEIPAADGVIQGVWVALVRKC